MYWREARAAYEARCLVDWPFLSEWHKAWIIATVETIIDIGNATVK